MNFIKKEKQPKIQIQKGVKKGGVPLRYKRVAEKLVTPEVAARFFELFKKGLSRKEIAKALCVPIEAFGIVYGGIDWGKRGNITFFVNKNPGKWEREFKAELKKSKQHQKIARKKRVNRDNELARLKELKEERNETDPNSP